MKKTAVLFLVAVLFVLFSGSAMAKDPPLEPEPWDKSSVTVEGACLPEGGGVYTVTNAGSGNMTGPTTWYQASGWTGGASSCAANVAAGYEFSGTVTLMAGESVQVIANPLPGAICVQQRPLHPGTGWTHAAIDSACEPPPPPPVCSNFPEWTEVPDGWEQMPDGTCVEKPEDPQDQCPDLDGFQPPLPPGWYVVDGLCVEDLCTNIDGIQTEVPENMQAEDGICLEPTALEEWQEPGLFVRWKIFLPVVVR